MNEKQKDLISALAQFELLKQGYAQPNFTIDIGEVYHYACLFAQALSRSSQEVRQEPAKLPSGGANPPCVSNSLNQQNLTFPANIVADRHEVTGKWVMWYLTDEQAKMCETALAHHIGDDNKMVENNNPIINQHDAPVDVQAGGCQIDSDYAGSWLINYLGNMLNQPKWHDDYLDWYEAADWRDSLRAACAFLSDRIVAKQPQINSDNSKVNIVNVSCPTNTYSSR